MNQTTRISENTLKLTETALMAAALCILGPVSIPIGPIPVSLQIMIIYLTVYVLGAKQGTLAYIIYILLGIVGLPVFSGFTGGLQKVAGPTGGFLVGFIPMALLGGFLIDRFWDRPVISAVIMYLAEICFSYSLGTLWFMFSAGTTLRAALTTCVIPFMLIDLGKIIAVALAGPLLRRQLIRAGLFIGSTSGPTAPAQLNK